MNGRLSHGMAIVNRLIQPEVIPNLKEEAGSPPGYCHSRKEKCSFVENEDVAFYGN
jgi:hypothetical protein